MLGGVLCELPDCEIVPLRRELKVRQGVISVGIDP